MDGETSVADIAEPIESPEVDFPDTAEAPEHTTETPIVEEGPEEAPTPSRGDEQISSPEIKAALKALREADPKFGRVADELRKAYFAQEQWTQAFPTPREAREAKLAWDSVGGQKGFADLRDKEQWIQWVDQAAEAGDPSIIEDWARDFPNGFRQMMPHAVNRFAQMDREGFSQAIAPHFSRWLDGVQLGDRLQQAYFAIRDGNHQGAQSILSTIFDWVAAYKQYSQQGQGQGQNPQEEKLAQREREILNKEDTIFRREIGRQTWGYQVNAVEKALKPFLSRSKLSEQAKTRLVATINNDLNNNMLADEGFQRQVAAFLAKKDSQGTVRFIQGHLDNIAPEIVRRAYQDLYGAAPRASRAPGPMPQPPQNGQNGQKPLMEAAIRIPRKPAMSDIQKGADYMTAYIAGKAVMAKGPYKGKLVQWR